MRIRSSTVVAIGVAFTLATAHAAVADAKPTPSASPVSDYQNALIQFNLDLQQYRNLISDRERSRKLITQEFIVAVSSANNAAKAAMRTAKTADAKTAIGDQLKSSIRAANEARDAANAGLGPLPVEPVKPVKHQEISPLKKTKSEKASPTPDK